MFGTKECPDCDNILLAESVLRPHSTGNGKCNVCHGKGHTPLEGAIGDFVSEPPSPCWNCKGKRKCPTCRGKGTVKDTENSSETDVIDLESIGEGQSDCAEECEEDDIDDVKTEDSYYYSGGASTDKLNSEDAGRKYDSKRFRNMEFDIHVFTPSVLLLLLLATLISLGILWNTQRDFLKSLIKRFAPQAVSTGPEDTAVIPAGQSVKHRRSRHAHVSANSTRPDAHSMPSHSPDRQTVQLPNKRINLPSGPDSDLDTQPIAPPFDRAEQTGSLKHGAFGTSGNQARPHVHSANNAVSSAPPIILWARHKHIVGGCSGQFQLWKDELKFIAGHQLRLKRSDISSIDGPGFVDKSGKKWHFKVEGKTDAEFHEILLQWKEELN